MNRRDLFLNGALGAGLLSSCFGGGGVDQKGGNGSRPKAVSLPGITASIADKTPKYRLFCAKDLDTLKTMTKPLKEFTNFDDGDPLSLDVEAKSGDLCFIDVAAKVPSDGTGFTFAKGADGKALQGVFYRSAPSEVSDGKLSIKLYRTFDSATGPLDFFVKATFPKDAPIKDLKAATLACGSGTYKSTSTQPEGAQTVQSKVSFSIPKAALASPTKCKMLATINGDSFEGSGINLPIKADEKALAPAEVSMVKGASGSDTLIVKPTIEP